MICQRSSIFSEISVKICEIPWRRREFTENARGALREIRAVVIIENVPHASGIRRFRSAANPATISVKRTVLAARGQQVSKRGQVAQG